MDNDYTNDLTSYGSDGYAEYGTTAPSAHAQETGPVVTGNAQVSKLTRGLEGLGEFTAQQRCFVGPLARLAWAFLATTAEGRTYDALGILSVYRSLYNSQRATIASGFSAAARDALPASLSEDAWTESMRLSMQLVLASQSTQPAQARALGAMPPAVSAIPAWFADARRSWDETGGIRTYLEVPRVGGESVAASVLAAVRDDVDRCLAPSPTVGPATGLAPCPAGTVRVGGRCQSVVVTGPISRRNPAEGGGGGGGSAQNPSGSGFTPPEPSRAGGGLLIGLLALLAAGAWWVYREEERISQAKLQGGGEDDLEDAPPSVCRRT